MATTININISLDWQMRGFSLALDGTDPRPGAPESFAVSLRDRTRTFGEQPTTAQILHYIADNLEVLSKPGFFLGGWKEGDLYYLDTSVVVAGWTLAILIGKANDQLAVYDLAQERVIPLDAKTATTDARC